MAKRVLILTTIPAPYRYEVFCLLSEKFKTEIFYERSKDLQRNVEWLKKGNVNCLDSKECKRYYKSTIAELEQFDYVLIYEYSTITAMRLMIKCIEKNVPYAINCDGAFIKHNFIKNKVKSFFVKHADLCLANGKSAANYFKYLGAYEEKIKYHKFTSMYERQIQDKPISEKLRTALREELKLPEGICAIAVGRFVKSKAFDILIDVWKELPANYNLFIIGGGSEKHNLEKQIVKLQLTNVKIYDYMNSDKLKKYYQASDMFVFPTLRDVWGLVVNEAMANGLPVITTEMCNAGKELIENGINGYIVPIRDKDAIKNAVIKIGGNDDLRNQMSINNLKKIRGYTYENIVKSHIEAIGNRGEE